MHLQKRRASQTSLLPIIKRCIPIYGSCYAMRFRRNTAMHLCPIPRSLKPIPHSIRPLEALSHSQHNTPALAEDLFQTLKSLVSYQIPVSYQTLMFDRTPASRSSSPSSPGIMTQIEALRLTAPRRSNYGVSGLQAGHAAGRGVRRRPRCWRSALRRP